MLFPWHPVAVFRPKGDREGGRGLLAVLGRWRGSKHPRPGTRGPMLKGSAVRGRQRKSSSGETDGGERSPRGSVPLSSLVPKG